MTNEREKRDQKPTCIYEKLMHITGVLRLQKKVRTISYQGKRKSLILLHLTWEN